MNLYILRNLLIILLITSCNKEQESKNKQLNFIEAIKICENGLIQTLDKDVTEYGDIELKVIGVPMLVDRSWKIDFKLIPNTPKNFMKCVAKYGGGVSISLVSVLD